MAILHRVAEYANVPALKEPTLGPDMSIESVEKVPWMIFSNDDFDKDCINHSQ